jgi:hypothetical protein
LYFLKITNLGDTEIVACVSQHEVKHLKSPHVLPFICHLVSASLSTQRPDEDGYRVFAFTSGHVGLAGLHRKDAFFGTGFEAST